MSFASSSNRFVGRNFPFIFSRLLCSKSCPLGLRLFAFALYIYYLKWTVTVAVNVTDGCDPSRPICLVWRTCHWTQRNSDLHSPPPFCGVLSTFEGAALACIWWLLKLWIAPFVWLCVVDKAFAVSCCTNNIPLTTCSISYFYLCILILMSIQESKIAVDKSPLLKLMCSDSSTRDSATGVQAMEQSKSTSCVFIHHVFLLLNS